ncbi:hypothetical protein AVEN_257911-1 [Araneus ventricosus]|uniref:Uncharacterized protein n=1 Tax=Araneus ventricosus TaxID=182803 RepID=A0A4Y2N902_ARAVE|nr:hypothetical protein AVEN_257911-1 [Araneus ventricosus]
MTGIARVTSTCCSQHTSMYVVPERRSTTPFRSSLDAKFPRRWIGRGGPTHGTARSPDLSSLDFFLWGHLKSLVYESPIDSDEDLVARISVAAGAVR